jgi:hypothetical protein
MWIRVNGCIGGETGGRKNVIDNIIASKVPQSLGEFLNMDTVLAIAKCLTFQTFSV